MPAPAALKAKWFWYSVLCVLCWGGWALASKTGSLEIPERPMQFIFTFGTAPVALALLFARGLKLEKSGKGIFYALLNGVLSQVGALALLAAYRTGGNTSVITAASALYPMVTILLAVTLLRERLTRLHILGLGFAVVAFVIFSL